MALQYTVNPAHRCSFPSVAPQHTVRPEHKKAGNYYLPFYVVVISILVAIYSTELRMIIYRQ
jgi:hypothetical protein